MVKTVKKTKSKIVVFDERSLEKIANEILELSGTKAKAKVSLDKENDAYLVDISTSEETGLLIGAHGETLESIQRALALIVRNYLGEWKRVVVNIGDWREKQEERLKELAKEAAEKVKQTGKEEPLYNLNASQRRIIHMVLSTDDKVITESQGEGTERFIVVKPKE